MTLRYRQVDVFSSVAYRGNGLAVFPDRGDLSPGQMLAIAGELNQFESIFLAPGGHPSRASARIFTVTEELPFAGHPVLGAAAVLHLERSPDQTEASWELMLGPRNVMVETHRIASGYAATMDQGLATFGEALSPQVARPFLDALELPRDQHHPDLPLQVVSTGLPCLIVPVRGDLGSGRIRHPAFEQLLATVGAKFVYLLDPERLEGRTWDNAGLVEDVATGSAAGPAGAYLVRHGRETAETVIRVSQGARAGRPSELRVVVRPQAAGLRVTVGGDVVPIGEGVLHRLPPP